MCVVSPQLASSSGILYFETSAESGENVQELFETLATEILNQVVQHFKTYSLMHACMPLLCLLAHSLLRGLCKVYIQTHRLIHIHNTHTYTHSLMHSHTTYTHQIIQKQNPGESKSVPVESDSLPAVDSFTVEPEISSSLDTVSTSLAV